MEDRLKYKVWVEYEIDGEKYSNMEDILSWYLLTQSGELMSYGIGGFKLVKSDDSIKYTKTEILLCTGRKDCNNSLIFDKDIILTKGNNGMEFKYIVSWDNKQLKFILQNLDGSYARDFAWEFVENKKLYKHGYKIIGNIYTTPELLEV